MPSVTNERVQSRHIKADCRTARYFLYRSFIEVANGDAKIGQNLPWRSTFTDQRSKRRKTCFLRDLLTLLEESQRDNFAHLSTANDSWFSLEYPRDAIWAPSADVLQERISQPTAIEGRVLST
jgi:hypothetical protein